VASEKSKKNSVFTRIKQVVVFMVLTFNGTKPLNLGLQSRNLSNFSTSHTGRIYHC